MTTPHYPTDLGVFDAPPPAARPNAVNIAFLLLLASTALSIIGTVIAVVVSPTDFSVPPATDEGLTPEQLAQVESITRIIMIVGVVVALGFTAFLVVATFKMRLGRNWARILLTIVGGASVVLTIVATVSLPALRTVGSAGDVVVLATSWVQMAAIVAAIVLMFRPAANQYFRRH